MLFGFQVYVIYGYVSQTGGAAIYEEVHATFFFTNNFMASGKRVQKLRWGQGCGGCFVSFPTHLRVCTVVYSPLLKPSS